MNVQGGEMWFPHPAVPIDCQQHTQTWQSKMGKRVVCPDAWCEGARKFPGEKKQFE